MTEPRQTFVTYAVTHPRVTYLLYAFHIKVAGVQGRRKNCLCVLYLITYTPRLSLHASFPSLSPGPATPYAATFALELWKCTFVVLRFVLRYTVPSVLVYESVGTFQLGLRKCQAHFVPRCIPA